MTIISIYWYPIRYTDRSEQLLEKKSRDTSKYFSNLFRIPSERHQTAEMIVYISIYWFWMDKKRSEQ